MLLLFREWKQLIFPLIAHGSILKILNQFPAWFALKCVSLVPAVVVKENSKNFHIRIYFTNTSNKMQFLGEEN